MKALISSFLLIVGILLYSTGIAAHNYKKKELPEMIIDSLSPSGGTMTGALGIATGTDQPLTLNKTSGSTWNYIGFSYNNTRKAYIGLDGNANLVLGSDVNGISINAPLTQSTSLDQPFTIDKASGSNWNYIGFSNSGIRKGYVGLDMNANLIVGSDVGNISLAGSYIITSGIFAGSSATFTGNVGIGTTTPSEKLSVNGNIKSRKVIVTQTNWPDYVFDSSYQLKPLSQVEQFVRKNKHLPDIPSAKEAKENGISVGDNQALLLKKIEELTLYVIDLQKKVVSQQTEINGLYKQVQHK